MAYKNLLVHLDETSACEKRAEAAIGLARAHDAHLTALGLVVEPIIPSCVHAQVPVEVLKARRKVERDRTEAMLDGNWKVAIENFAECYHCELLHREFTQGIVDPRTYRVSVYAASQKHHSRAYTGNDQAYTFDAEASDEFVAWWLWPNFAFQSYPGGRVHFHR